MSPGPMRRRMVRRAIRAPISRNLRIVRRIIWRTTKRLIFGTSVILLIGGSYAIYKIAQSDVQRIEQDSGKPVENMTERELKKAIKEKGIQKLELTPEEEAEINKVGNEPETKRFCMYCGAQLDFNAKFCPNCGQKV
ncbi:MAG: zinc ribbon domain-containing protein [Candidatus Thorarchaeota archaeon]